MPQASKRMGYLPGGTSGMFSRSSSGTMSGDIRIAWLDQGL